MGNLAQGESLQADKRVDGVSDRRKSLCKGTGASDLHMFGEQQRSQHDRNIRRVWGRQMWEGQQGAGLAGLGDYTSFAEL